MKKSHIYERIYLELNRLKMTKKSFTRKDLRKLILNHQKYSVFVYKHSDKKNKGKMTLYFIRGKKIDNLISFKLDYKVVNMYKKKFNLNDNLI
jgi:hypothetical protein